MTRYLKRGFSINFCRSAFSSPMIPAVFAAAAAVANGSAAVANGSAAVANGSAAVANEFAGVANGSAAVANIDIERREASSSVRTDMAADVYTLS
ncbi:unnamed protein product [Closterium sp. NIES-54]